jgi:hypothetical protein
VKTSGRNIAACQATGAVVADDRRLPFAQRCNEGNHVADIVQDAVGLDFRGRSRPAEAPHVGRNHMEAGRGQRRDLVAPGIGQFRPAMAEHDQRAFALFEQEHVDPVDRNRARG